MTQPAAGPVPDPLWDALSAAALALERESERFREDAASGEEVARVTAALVESLREAAAGRAVAETVPRGPLARRTLALLRREVLVRAEARERPPAPEDVLALLRALETVAEAMDPAWDERFEDRLTGPDGLELIVEVAHDLRSPLTSILFLAETLLRGRSGPVTPLQERQLGLIYGAAFGLSSVASDMVELVRGRDRPLDMEPVPFSVADILESVRDIVRPIAEEKGLEMVLGFPSRPMRVGFPVALNRVLLNLTTNALKFTDEGRVEITVAEPDDERIEFSVRDTGRGIPPSAMPLLFEPFRRRQRDREYAFSGAGLGLSICRKLVEAMGSTLAVETELGRGTRFGFTLRLPVPDISSDALLGPAANTAGS